jgi:hypothetical protein
MRCLLGLIVPNTVIVQRLATIHEESADETGLKHVRLESLLRYLDDNLIFLIFSPFCEQTSGSASEEQFLGGSSMLRFSD